MASMSPVSATTVVYLRSDSRLFICLELIAWGPPPPLVPAPWRGYMSLFGADRRDAHQPRSHSGNRRRRHRAVPAAPAAGGARLPGGGDDRGAAPAGAGVRGRRGGPSDLRAGGGPADVLAGARPQPAPAAPGDPDGRAGGGHRVQPDDRARLPGGPGLRLVAAREPVP